MSPKTKRTLAWIMMLGDVLMGLVGILLILDGEIGLGLFVWLFVLCDCMLTADYISELTRRIKLNESLEKENAIEGYIRNEATKVKEITPSVYPEPQTAKQPIDEEDLSDILNQQNNQNQQMHG